MEATQLDSKKTVTTDPRPRPPPALKGRGADSRAGRSLGLHRRTGAEGAMVRGARPRATHWAE